MGRAVELAVRRLIVERHERGEAFGQIAQQLGLSYWTVRSIYRSWHKQGNQALQTHYERCGRPAKRRLDSHMWRSALALRRHHSHWGAGVIRVMLSRRWPDHPLPSRRTLGRWLAAANLIPKKSRVPKGPSRDRAREVHETWQIDAKEEMAMADRSWASWLAISDEHSGAALAAEVFPPQALGASHATVHASRAASDL